MKEFLLQILIVAYAAVGIVSAIAYWPTIKDLLNNKPSANNISYIIWVITTAITLLYSIFILDDFLFRAVSIINFTACLLVLILSLRIKK